MRRRDCIARKLEFSSRETVYWRKIEPKTRECGQQPFRQNGISIIVVGSEKEM